MHVSITLMESKKRDASKGRQLGRAKEKSERQEAESVSDRGLTHPRAQRGSRVSSNEPSNQAGSVTGTNSVVCSYGKMVEH